MKVKLSHSSEPVSVESFRIEIGDNEFLLKEVCDGIQITNVDIDVIRIQPQVANSIILLVNKNGNK